MSENLDILQTGAREILDQPDLVLNVDDRIANVRGWDSVAMVQILLLLENQEGIQFDTVEIANIKTVGDIVGMLDKLL